MTSRSDRLIPGWAGRLVVLALAVGTAGAAFAVRSPLPERGRWMPRVDAGAGGLRPWSVDMSHLGASYRTCRMASAARRLKSAAIPSAWDSRDHGWVSSVKNQTPYGTCWTFSTMAALESSILRSGGNEYDLSENHLANHDVGFLWGFNDGGNNQMATALVTAWRDPLGETEDPYANPGAKVELPPAFHIQNVVWLPERESSDDTATDLLLKQAVMDHGAVSVGYLHCFSCYDSQLGAYYLPDDSYYKSGDGGHAVALIGWDDAYPSNNFPVTPPGNGAFLCKNSWGKSAGTNGCIWISYHDSYFGFMASAAYPAPEATNNYGRVYQYDSCGQVATWNVYLDTADQNRGGKENWCANMFTAPVTGVVEAVGFYALAAGTEYELRVYADCLDTPSSGTLVAEQSGKTDVAGFITLPLATPVPLATGLERFAVVMHLESPDTEFPLPVTCNHYEEGELFCTNEAHLGESFLSSNGVDWVDFQNYPGANRTENLCIKAYTRYGADGKEVHFITTADPADGRVSVKAGEQVGFSVEVVGENPKLEWRVDNVLQTAGGNSFVYAPAPADHGTHEVACRVLQGNLAEVRSWTVAVTSLLHVDAVSVAVNPDGTGENPFPSINAALAVALPGDEVTVAAGIYFECVTPYVALPITAEAGPGQTFIDANGTNRCYYGGYVADASLSGFTLMNGNAGYGGGAYMGMLSNCVITACVANYGGGAYDCTLVDCTICSNDVCGYSVGYGPWTHWYDGYSGGADSCTLLGCVISNCTATYGCGGGVAYSTLTNCLVTGCRATYDGGGACESMLVNCTVAGNSAGEYGGGAYLQYSGGAVNTVTADNSSDLGYDYGNDVYGNLYWYMTASISDQDARFVDSTHGDYHLKADSPAVDAGENSGVMVTTDLEGKPRIVGARVDMGAFERQVELATGWPDPGIAKGDSAATESNKVMAAMTEAGFAAAPAAAVTTLADYSALMDWAAAAGLAIDRLTASSSPIVAAAVGSTNLLELTEEDRRIAAFAPADGGWKFCLNLPDYDPDKVNLSLVKAAIGVKGTADLRAPMTADDLSVQISPGTGNVEVVVGPPASATNYFFCTTIR